MSALAKYRKTLHGSLTQMDGGQLPDSVKPLQPAIVGMLERLDAIPGGEQWGTGGFETLNSFINKVGLDHTVLPICEFFESGIIFEKDMKDPMGTLAKITAEINRCATRPSNPALYHGVYTYRSSHFQYAAAC